MKKTAQIFQRNVIGSQIRKIRMACQPPVTQEDLVGRLAARGVTMDQTAISRIENQTRYLMDYEIVAIAKSLKVPINKLFDEING